MIHNKIMWKKPYDRQWKSNSRAFFFPRMTCLQSRWRVWREYTEMAIHTSRWVCTRLLIRSARLPRLPARSISRNPTKSFLALPLSLGVARVQTRMKMFCKQLHHTLVSHQIASCFFFCRLILCFVSHQLRNTAGCTRCHNWNSLQWMEECATDTPNYIHLNWIFLCSSAFELIFHLRVSLTHTHTRSTASSFFFE